MQKTRCFFLNQLFCSFWCYISWGKASPALIGKTKTKGKSTKVLNMTTVFQHFQRNWQVDRNVPRVIIKSICSISLHLLRMFWIFVTLSGTTAVSTTLAPPSLFEEELITETALGPLFNYKGVSAIWCWYQYCKNQLIPPGWTNQTIKQLCLRSDYT